MRDTIKTMPKVLRRVAEYCGERVAKRLWEVFPGARLSVPIAYVEGGSLSGMGEEDARSLIEYFAGERLDVPLNIVTKEAKQAQVIALASAGKALNEIALDVGYTRRGVKRILKAHRSKHDASPA